MPTDPATERKALALLERVADVPRTERDAWIARHAGGDEAVVARACAILSADDGLAIQTGGAFADVGDEAVPERVGAYRITELIGRGGMGAVYRGERMTGDFARTAAVKLIKPGLLSERLVERFQHERQTLARLEHAHIARLYDGGAMPDGAPFLVMEFVDGDPIVDWSAAHEADTGQRLRLFEDACAAVAYAHSNLVVHRDISPSNVLVTGEGVVKLIDFGIARPVEAVGDSARRSDNSLASLSLTPGYARPSAWRAVKQRHWATSMH